MGLRLITAVFILAAVWQTAPPERQKETASQAPYVEKSEKEFAFYPGGKLEINASAPGSFRITGWDSASIRVELERIFFYVSPQQGQELAKSYPVRITYTPTLARIMSAGSPKPSAVMEINAVVFVPRERTDLSIKMIKGDLAISTLNGAIEATIEEGSVEAQSVSGYFSAMTKMGNLNVDLGGKRWAGHSFTAATKRGTITLTLPAEYSAALQLETKDGDISVDYPDQIVDGEAVPLQVREKKKVRSLNMNIGSGGSLVRLVTLSGNIVFKSKPVSSQDPG